MDFAQLQQIGVAVLLASLIGIEREKRAISESLLGFAGVRTHALIGLLGALSYILAQISIVYFVVIAAGFMGLLISAYVASSRRKIENIGATSEIASILVFVIGIFSAMEQYVLATTLALTVMGVLYFKKTIHYWTQRLAKAEIMSTLEFIIIAFVVLPLLPNQEMGPYGFFNPHMIWLMVVFISGLSFLSYFAIKLFGAKKGVCITGFLAGFISSTALTLAYSAESRKNRTIENPYLVAVVIASSAMFFRVIVEVAVINRELLSAIVVPMVLMGITGLGFAFYYFWKGDNGPKKKVKEPVHEVKSPFSLVPALKFGVFFAAILFFTEFASAYAGDSGIYITSLISGILDVDAITVSISTLSNNGLSHGVAAGGIVLAAITNTMAKATIFMMFGNRKIARKILVIFLIVAVVGALALQFI